MNIRQTLFFTVVLFVRICSRLLCALLLAITATAQAQSPVTTRVSVDSAGTEADGDSGNPTISADGRHVAFDSNATNLIGNDTNGAGDIFVHDRIASPLRADRRIK